MQANIRNLVSKMFLLEQNIMQAQIRAAELELSWLDCFIVGNENLLQEAYVDFQRKNAISSLEKWLHSIHTHADQFQQIEAELHTLIPPEQSDKLLYLADDSRHIHADSNYAASNEHWFENMQSAKEQAFENLESMQEILIHNQELLLAEYSTKPDHAIQNAV